jgi:hypothetical protein
MSSDQPIFILNDQVFANQSLAVSANSLVAEIKEARTFSVQIITAGSSFSGSVQVQASDDNINWASDGSPFTISAAGSQMLNFPDRGYAYVRLAFTAVTGVGTLNALISAKR